MSIGATNMLMQIVIVTVQAIEIAAVVLAAVGFGLLIVAIYREVGRHPQSLVVQSDECAIPVEPAADRSDVVGHVKPL